MGHIIGPRAVLCEDGLRLRVLLPRGAAEQGLEAIGPAAIDHHHMLQVGQAGLEALDHLLVVKATKHLGHDDHFGFAVLEHERQLTLPKDVHERVHHRADARARQVGDGELPPVGQLASHDVVVAHA